LAAEALAKAGSSLKQKLHFGEPPKPAPEPGALPRKQKRPAEAGRFEFELIV
jgi:hypothetical protein